MLLSYQSCKYTTRRPIRFTPGFSKYKIHKNDQDEPKANRNAYLCRSSSNRSSSNLIFFLTRVVDAASDRQHARHWSPRCDVPTIKAALSQKIVDERREIKKRRAKAAKLAEEAAMKQGEEEEAE